MMPDSARDVWRRGIAPQLSTAALQALAAALERDDPAVMQGSTVSPPPLAACLLCPVEAACPVGYAGWQGEGIATVGGIDKFFNRICEAADAVLGKPLACWPLINWVDQQPRPAMRAGLLAEVRRTLGERTNETTPLEGET